MLRLYDGKYSRPGVLKRAKTQLFGFGDPFLHVAVSTDGEWVLSKWQRDREERSGLRPNGGSLLSLREV